MASKREGTCGRLKGCFLLVRSADQGKFCPPPVTAATITSLPVAALEGSGPEAQISPWLRRCRPPGSCRVLRAYPSPEQSSSLTRLMPRSAQKSFKAPMATHYRAPASLGLPCLSAPTMPHTLVLTPWNFNICLSL